MPHLPVAFDPTYGIFPCVVAGDIFHEKRVNYGYRLARRAWRIYRAIDMAMVDVMDHGVMGDGLRVAAGRMYTLLSTYISGGDVKWREIYDVIVARCWQHVFLSHKNEVVPS